VRFEPGDEKEVQLVEIAGSKRIKGLNSLTDAQVNSVTLKASLQKAELKNFI
jgi:urease subunit beta/urease subunit gamma/beta